MGRSTVLKDIPPANYYFVGIGGYGMSGLAQILATAGYSVRGSDARESERVARLRRSGVEVNIGHDAAWVHGADVLIYSTDIPADNPELMEARRLGIEIQHRSSLLARLINSGNGIAVTGTHGKTTVTAMISSFLLDAGLDPTVSVGAEVDRLGGTGRLGKSQWVVAEACESDGTFLKYRPHIAVITNIEPEHLEHYDDSYDRLRQAFRQFVAGLPADGTLVIPADDSEVSALAQFAPGEVVTFGTSPDAHVRAVELQHGPLGRYFQVEIFGTVAPFPFHLAVPGVHNVRNALAAIAVGTKINIPLEVMAGSLAVYTGAHRRFQIVSQGNGIVIVDDYAHHPTEIKATLAAARERSQGRIVAVFQPQRYSRTQRLMEEFSRAFDLADRLVLLPIYSPPGEKPIPGVSGEVLAQLVEQRAPGKVVFQPDKEAAIAWLRQEVKPGDLVVTMGAGDVWQVAYQLANQLSLSSKS